MRAGESSARPGQRHRGTRDRNTGLCPAAAPRRPEPPPSSGVVGAGAGGAGSGAWEP